MSRIFVSRGKKAIIMEVIGLNGQKVAEYVDKGDKKIPNYVLLEEGSL